jgi:hypothetical protein
MAVTSFVKLPSLGLFRVAAAVNAAWSVGNAVVQDNPVGLVAVELLSTRNAASLSRTSSVSDPGV